MTVPSRVRWIEPVARPIAAAADLGSVLTLKRGALFLLCDPFGDIHPDSRGLGLYLADARILSCASLHLNGRRPALLRAATGGGFEASVELTNADPSRNVGDKIDPSALSHRAIAVRRRRLLGASFAERLEAVNHGETSAELRFDLALGADFADIFEVRGYQRPTRGSLLPIALDPTGRRIEFAYLGTDGHERRSWVAFDTAASLDPPDPDDTALADATVVASWTWRLEPGEARTLDWAAWGDEPRPPSPALRRHPGRRRPALRSAIPTSRREDLVHEDDAWRTGMADYESDHEILNRTLEGSIADLRQLVTPGPDAGEGFLAAGVPWFTALFGRDAIIASLETLALRPALAAETLVTLAAHQSTELDEWCDAEPGKIPHELRKGELAAAGELPFRRYYGSVDATPLWLVLLAETYAWTGDRALVDRLWPNALAALEWLDRWGDRDGDGFVEYERRSPRGLINQGWKDSRDSIRDRSGRPVEAPVALAEVQGYVYAAKRGLARLARVRGDHSLGEMLDRDAEALRDRFEAAFWLEDRGYYAMALDRDKHPADAIASNAGQCLWTGIVARERAERMVSRLLDPALYSGWGIRTYAAGQTGYNPLGYHTGSVWPHDIALIAAGLKRYGLAEAAERVAVPLLEAAATFAGFRLPELFCGYGRDADTGPVPYPVACSPQAWSAGAPFLILRTMLGLQADAEAGRLELIEPRMPRWIGSLRVRGLAVGDATVDLLIHTWRGTTSAEVLARRGDLDVTVRL